MVVGMIFLAFLALRLIPKKRKIKKREINRNLTKLPFQAKKKQNHQQVVLYDIDHLMMMYSSRSG